MPKVLIASDHAGFALKEVLIGYVSGLGFSLEDLGASVFDKEDDYPDFISPLAKRVAVERDAMGIVIGGSGQGEAMCANRIPGIRAAVFYGSVRAMGAIDADGASGGDGYDVVRLSREHNNANVLSLGARFVSEDAAKEAVRLFLSTAFSSLPRHARRIAKY